MIKLKEYINNNKQLLFIFLGGFAFLFIYNIAYCNPMLILTLMPNLPEKLAYDFAPYVFNKVVAFTPYAVQGAGWFVVGSTITLTGIKVAEYGYNWKYIIGSATNTVPFAEEFKGGFRKFYGWMTGRQITPVNYTYFYPKIANTLGYPNLFNSKVEVDLSTWEAKMTKNSDNSFVSEHQEPLIAQVPIEKTITKKERVIIEKHDEDVLQLTEAIKRLDERIQQESLIRANLKSDEGILNELASISLLEEIPTYTRTQLRSEFKTFKVPNATEDEAGSPINIPVLYIEFNSVKDVKIKFKTSTETFVYMDRDVFASKYPTIFAVGSYLDQKVLEAARARPSRGDFKTVYFCPSYDIKTSFFGKRFEYNPENSKFCLYPLGFEYRDNPAFPLIDPRDEEYNALEKIREYQLQEVATIHENITSLTEEVRNAYNTSLQRNNPQDSMPEEKEDELLSTAGSDQGVAEALTPTITQTVGAATAVGLVTLLSTTDAFVVLSYLLTNNPFVPLIQNPAVAQALVELYTSNDIALPSYLQNVSLFNDTSSVVSNISDTFNQPQHSTTSVTQTSWGSIIGGVLVGGLLIYGALHLWKQTGDTSVLKAASNLSAFEKDLLSGLNK